MPPLFTVLQYIMWGVGLYGYFNTLCQRAMQCVGVAGDVIYGYFNTFCQCKVLGGCNLWVLPLAQRARPTAKLGPCIVHNDPTTPTDGHTCKLQSASTCLWLCLPHPGWKQQTRLQRGFGSKKPSCLLHPAAALMGSEGSQTAWAVNFTSLVLITPIHHDLGWLDVASKCIDPRLFSVGPLC